KLSFLLNIAQCVVDYSRQCKTQIVIGFIVLSRLICLELICTSNIGGGEYNLKDSDLRHALKPCPISSFSVQVTFMCSRFSSPKIFTNKMFLNCQCCSFFGDEKYYDKFMASFKGCSDFGVRCEEISIQVFYEMDIKQVIEEAPWTFNSHLLIIHC
ncbi:hypothetical protein Goshw_017903, partial [Gossypium schwendimanii]|nr:hypothetical protein [Gossypium schwendimanii]